MSLHDAHNHLQHERLAPFLEQALEELSNLSFGRAMVNGTRESDWANVAALAQQHSWIIPSFGVHPWYAPMVSDRYEEVLRGYLQRFPSAAIGEIGLDRWIEGHDLAVQTPIFTRQLQIAHEFNRVVTIHCVRAWGALIQILRAEVLPARGFLLHAYGGPAEMVAEFSALGAYFSFSPYFLHDRKAAQRGIFAELPLDRLLVETDAPDMAPPTERSRFGLRDQDGKPLNHPANIILAYETLADLRGMPPEELTKAVARNFARLFTPSLPA